MHKFYIVSTWRTKQSEAPDIVAGPLQDQKYAFENAHSNKERYGKECLVTVTEISRYGSNDILRLNN